MEKWVSDIWVKFFCMVEESQGLLISIQLSHRVGLPDSSVGTESTCNAGDPSSIPGSGRSAGEGIVYPHQYSRAFLVAQLVKNLPAVWETWVPSMGWEDPLEKRKATTPVFWPGEYHELHSPWGCKELDKTEQISLSHLTEYVETLCFLDEFLWYHNIHLHILPLYKL